MQVTEKLSNMLGGENQMKLLLFILGILIGIVIGILLKKNKPVGSLKAVLDKDEGNKPYLFLELDRSVDDLYGKKTVVFRVELPHK